MAQRILLVYGTKDGQTSRIATRLAAHLRERDLDVTVFRGDALPSTVVPSDFDGVVVGASIRFGRHQGYMRRFVRRQVSALNALPTAFFSVSCAAASPQAEGPLEAQQRMTSFFEKTGWQPGQAMSIAGALRYRGYDPITRWVMKRIAAKTGLDTDTSCDHEYTDWSDVERFASFFTERVRRTADTAAVAARQA
jgi:menaquinone-dependent protoporphyrinogen oxidase